MAVRSFITAGAAFATAGMVALVPAIAPPLAPRDIQVVKQTEAQVNLAAALTLTDLINVYFGVSPQLSYPTVPPAPPNTNPLPAVTGAPGTSGLAGVLYQLLYAQQGSYVPGQVGLTQYFNGGLAAYIQLMLTTQNTDPDQVDGINAFFQGISELVRLYLVTNNTDPDQVAGIDAFFDGGTPQLAYEYLASGTSDPDSLEYLDIFFGQNDEEVTGATGVVYKRLRDGFTDPVQQANIDAFFTGGVTSVAQLQLLAGFQDPQQQQVINDFFGGGVTEVARTQILARVSDPNQAAIVNEFFDNGVSGVVRYLLAGPVPEDPTPPPPAPPMPLMKTLAFSAPEAEVAESTPEAEPEAPKAEAFSAPDPAPAPAPAPDPAPAAAPGDDPKPTFTAKIREVEAEEETEPDDGGANKVEPEIIIESGGAKPGSGSWGILGDIAQGVHDAIANAGKPATPASDTTGDADGEGGGEG